MIYDKLPECHGCEKAGIAISSCPNNSQGICVESADNRAAVMCKERGKKYTLENTGKNFVISYKVDGGIITEDKNVPQGTMKCDFLFAIGAEDEVTVLIELKDDNVLKAMRQIHSTLSMFKTFFNRFARVYARTVVTSSIPNLKASAEYVNLLKEIKQRKGNIKIRERKFPEKDIELEKA
jgi:hypothetical protein